MKLEDLKKEKQTMISMQLPIPLLKQIKAKAKKYASGNVSAWMRYAAANFDPKKVKKL